MPASPPVTDRQFTELDCARLRKLLAMHEAHSLADALDVADVVPGPEIDPAVVTMYSRFELEDAHTRERRILAICYPSDAAPQSGLISVLSPLGSSLIGQRAGTQVRWHTPAGERRGSIAAVLFQPEASGDYVT